MAYLIFLTQLALCACVIAAVATAYLRGVREGVDIIARVELNEWEAGIAPVPASAAEYVNQRRATVHKQDGEKIFQMWRKAQGLKDGSTARELFNDPEYRKQLEAQKHVG